MKLSSQLFVLAALTAVTPGCFISRSRVNESIDAAAYARLVPGASSQDDVLRELGAPSDIVQLGQRSAWRYDHTQAKSAAFWPILVVLRNEDIVQDRVWAFFNASGRLMHIGATFEADSASYKMPWQD